jgi:hypothetical protein
MWRQRGGKPAAGRRAAAHNGLFLLCKTFALVITIFLLPAIAFGLDNGDFDKYVSVSVQPYANWLFFAGPYLDYNLEPSVFTTAELSLEYKKYLKLLFDFDIKANDNFIGELADSKAFARIAGMLGLKNLALRAAWGQIEGEAIWNSAPIPGQPQSTTVSTKYMEFALLYNGPPLLLGVIYQNYHIPVELSYGYADDMVFNYYGAYLGASNFTSFMNETKSSRKNGVTYWLESHLSHGIALTEISEEARRRRALGSIIAQDKRTGTGSHTIDIRGDSPVAYSSGNQIILGVCGAVNAGKLFTLGFGAGYDGFIQWYMSADYNSWLIRHGATVRVYCSF